VSECKPLPVAASRIFWNAKLPTSSTMCKVTPPAQPRSELELRDDQARRMTYVGAKEADLTQPASGRECGGCAHARQKCPLWGDPKSKRNEFHRPSEAAVGLRRGGRDSFSRAGFIAPPLPNENYTPPLRK